MQNRIPEHKIDEIRQKIDIVEVISDYVQLRKQGRNYVGLCPFHGEKTPSFSVSPDKQLYHCFGCGAGGNVISFLMEIDGLTFLEAIEQLASRASIDLPELAQKTPQQSDVQFQLRKAYELAQKYYHYVLKETEFGEKGREYLKERGFTKELIDTFQIGYATDSWENLTSLLTNKGFNMKLMEVSGLLAKREFDGKLFDRFRNRVMFPIWDGQGQVIAFGGRILGEGQPKYLNSPETNIFHKSRTIYGIHLARPEIRKQNEAILFEGYVDVIAAWKAGVKNGIATLGTALTEEQAKIIRRNCEKVIICYDSDDAGVNAAYKAAELLKNAGCYVKIANLPEGYDPDDFIQKFGGEAFQKKVIENSLTLMSFTMQYLRRGKNLEDEGEKIRYIEEVLKEISKLPKAVERDHYLRRLAEEFSLSLDALKQEQYRIFRQQRKQTNQQYDNKPHKSHVMYVEPNKLLPAYQNAERFLLAYMMKDASISEQVERRIGGSFNIDAYQAIAAYLYAFYNEGNLPDTAKFIHRIPDQQLQKLATEIAMLQIKDEINEQELEDYMREIENHAKWVEIEQKEKQAANETDPIELAKLKNEILQLKIMLKR